MVFIFNNYKDLIAFRKKTKRYRTAILRPCTREMITSFAFSRSLGKQKVYLYMNLSETSKQVENITPETTTFIERALLDNGVMQLDAYGFVVILETQ